MRATPEQAPQGQHRRQRSLRRGVSLRSSLRSRLTDLQISQGHHHPPRPAPKRPSPTSTTNYKVNKELQSGYTEKRMNISEDRVCVSNSEGRGNTTTRVGKTRSGAAPAGRGRKPQKAPKRNVARVPQPLYSRHCRHHRRGTNCLN